MTDEIKNVECANCGEYSKEKFCSMTCALSRPDILEADAMIRAGKKDSPCQTTGVVGKSEAAKLPTARGRNARMDKEAFWASHKNGL